MCGPAPGRETAGDVMALQARTYVIGHGRGSTHGMDTSTDQHWSHQAACAGADADQWHVHTAQPNWTSVGRCIHICRRHCPVQEQCYREFAGEIKSAIIGGYYFNDSGDLSAYQPDPGTCTACRKGLAA